MGCAFVARAIGPRAVGLESGPATRSRPVAGPLPSLVVPAAMSLHHPPPIDVCRGGRPRGGGRTMRGYIVLLAVGIVAALIGAGGLAAGFSPPTHPSVFPVIAAA